MKTLKIIFAVFITGSMFLFTGCGSDDDGPGESSTEQKIGDALEGAWSVTSTDSDNPDNAYDNLTLTFGVYAQGSGGSISATNIAQEFKPNFGLTYTLNNPQSMSSFAISPGGNIQTIQVSGDPATGQINISFISDDGTGNGRMSGVGDYNLDMAKL